MDRRNVVKATALIGAALAATGQTAPALAQAPAPVPPSAGPSGTSSLDQVRKSGVLRIAAIVGQAPYFIKDIKTGTWTGACIEMANDIAGKLGAKVEVVESTWGNQILDLQSNKIDIAFAVNPTPERALVIDFSTPILVHSFTAVTRKGYPTPATWEDLNKPEVRIAVDLGSTHDLIARRYAPKANILGFKTRDEAVLAVSTGRADVNVVLAILSIPMLKKNPALGAIAIPRPVLTLPTNIGLRQESDRRWKEFLSVWADFNRSMGTTREWLIKGLAALDVTMADIPPEVQF